MKYPEYQVWYHVYTSVATSMFHSTANVDLQGIISKADAVANFAVDKFRTVDEVPQTEAPPTIDLQNMVDKVLKDVIKKK